MKMDELPMPSDLRDETKPAKDQELIEPPSIKLIVRLFLIPLAIVSVAVGIMFLVGLLAGGEPSLDDAVSRLRNPGGERTTGYLVGPASKQRYLDAKTLVDRMKAPEGMTEADRIDLAGKLMDILLNHTNPEEGEVQHFVLLALGRVWQPAPSQSPMNSPAAVASREEDVKTLLQFMDAPQLATRKAAVLASVYLAGQDQAAPMLPKLIEKVSDLKEDTDVRIAAATVLGPLANSSNQAVITALNDCLTNTDPRQIELVWSAALSLAELNQANVAETILKLLDRNELSKLQYYDRESDPQNPTFRMLNDQEQQRILINTMLGAKKLDVPSVQARLKDLAKNDPSARVRAAAVEILETDKVSP